MGTDAKISSSSSSRPRFFNKYVEYRRQYESACEKFSSKLDEAKSADKPKPEAAKKEAATDTTTGTGGAGSSGSTGKTHAKSAKVSNDDTSVSNEDSNVAPMSASSQSPTSIPNLGSASDRMMDRVKEYEPHIRAAASRYGIDPNWIAGIIWQESRGNPRAVSHCGAMGLMQLMPETAKNLGVDNAFDVGQNIDGGAKYLRQMLDKFGRMDFATAAYNAGPGNVSKFGGVPPFRETQDYVPHVLGFANSFKTANAFQDTTPSSAVRV